MNKLTPQQIHKNMSSIHSKDTKPEMVVRKYLWGHGFRYRLNHIFLSDHSARPYKEQDVMPMMAAEEKKRIEFE